MSLKDWRALDSPQSKSNRRRGWLIQLICYENNVLHDLTLRYAFWVRSRQMQLELNSNPLWSRDLRCKFHLSVNGILFFEILSCRITWLYLSPTMLCVQGRWVLFWFRSAFGWGLVSDSSFSLAFCSFITQLESLAMWVGIGAVDKIG